MICVACQAVTYLHVFRVFLSDSAEAALRDLTLGLMADSGFRTQLLLSLRDPRERARTPNLQRTEGDTIALQPPGTRARLRELHRFDLRRTFILTLALRVPGHAWQSGEIYE